MHAPPIPVGWSTARRRKLIPSRHRGTDLTTTAPLPSTPLRLRPRPELFLSRPTCPAVRLGRALRKRINALQALDRSCSPRCRSLLVWVTRAFATDASRPSPAPSISEKCPGWILCACGSNGFSSLAAPKQQSEQAIKRLRSPLWPRIEAADVVPGALTLRWTGLLQKYQHPLRATAGIDIGCLRTQFEIPARGPLRLSERR